MPRLLIPTLVIAASLVLLSPRCTLANPGLLGDIPTVAAGGHGGGGRIPGVGGGGIGLSFGGGRGGIHFGGGGAGISIGIGGGRHNGSRHHGPMVDDHRDTRRPPNPSIPWQAIQPKVHRLPSNPQPIPYNSIPNRQNPQPIPTHPQPIPPNPQPIPTHPQPIPPETNSLQAVSLNAVALNAVARNAVSLNTVSRKDGNHLPAMTLQKRIPGESHENALLTSGRMITAEEVKRADDFFHKRLNTLAEHLESKLPATRFDREQLVQLMAAKKVPAKTQVQIVDALDEGDHRQAQRLWMSALPCCWVPFGPSPGRDLLLKIRLAIEQRRLTSIDMQELAFRLHPGDGTTETPAEEICCGADDLVYQLEQEMQINMAITGIDAGLRGHFGKPNGYGKPEHDSSPSEEWKPNQPGKPEQLLASVPSGNSNGKERPGQPSMPNPPDKPNAFRKPSSHGVPGATVPLPTGLVNIIYHPKLPIQHVVVVNPKTVMVGTGGEGVFHMETGYVAEALGNRLASSPPLPGKDVEAVQSGILVMNPTNGRIQFKMGDREMSLDPGAQQIFRAKPSQIISFDRGNGTKMVRYSLKEGAYGFKIDHDGWNLLKTKYEIVISNQGNLKPFHYRVQGEPAVVKADDTRSHSSAYPIVIHFDRGNGTMTKHICYEKTKGTLQVAIHPGDNLWDLHEAPSDVVLLHSVLKKDPNFVPAF